MRTRQLARAQLFSTIEGGSIFWSSEIAELGPVVQWQRQRSASFARAQMLWAEMHRGLSQNKRSRKSLRRLK